MNDLEQLKELLFGAEKEALDSISERVGRREIRTDDVADILPEAIYQRHKQDGELVEAAEALHAERMNVLHESRDAWRNAAADRDSAENLKDRRVAAEASRARAAIERTLDELHITRQEHRR